LSEKRKKQFIPLPWKGGEIFLWRISKIDEYTTYFENYDLKFVEEMKGFDSNHFFYNHFLSVGLNPALLKSTINKEEENRNYHPSDQEADINYEDIEMVIITTKNHK
jgi:hypothetical protein